jgi:hypothetical protein
MQDYWAEPWQAIFEHNGFCSFDDFWQLKADLFEEPNLRRGGWSGVARCELKLPAGGVRCVFLKRQENHLTKTWRHPIRGMATLLREFRNFRRFERSGVPTARVLYFGQRRCQGKLCAVLATEELTGFRSLEELTEHWCAQGWPPPEERHRIIEAIACVIRRMHDARLWHHCLWSKHIFLKPSADGAPVEVRIIDLEKARWTPLRRVAARGDLSSLHRDCPDWSRTDRVRFYKAYLQVPRLRGAKKLWQAVADRSERRSRRRSLRMTAMHAGRS